MIDNYDSFTYNLVQYLMCLGTEVIVRRNNSITLKEIELMHPDMLVISPGPGSPDGAGICIETVKKFKGVFPILGVCLGHQIIGQVFGAEIVQAEAPVHGKVHSVFHTGKGLFRNLPNPLNVTRYHSLVIKKENMPESLEVTAETSKGEVMAIRHKQYLIEGVQFHPEALLTEFGMDMLKNFLEEARLH